MIRASLIQFKGDHEQVEHLKGQWVLIPDAYAATFEGESWHTSLAKKDMLIIFATEFQAIVYCKLKGIKLYKRNWNHISS